MLWFVPCQKIEIGEIPPLILSILILPSSIQVGWITIILVESRSGGGKELIVRITESLQPTESETTKL